MELLIDDANLKEIERIYEYYPVDGVTTNPSILAKYPEKPFTLLKAIRTLIGADAQLHVQAIAKDASGILEDAHAIVKALPGNTFVKIPSVPEGFKAMKQLHSEGIPITATAIYTPLQAFLAAKAGASYAAPYVNRIDNMGYDGVKVAAAIHDIFAAHSMTAKVLAASFKNSQQFLDLCKHGIKSATMAPGIFDNMVKNPAIDAAIDAFIDDFSKLTGSDATMKDLI